MRLISLNSWCGRSLYPLMNFLRTYRDYVDIFCLQEILNADQRIVDERHPEQYVCGGVYKKSAQELPGFNGTFAVYDDDPHRMSQAIFIKKDVEVTLVEDLLVFKPEVPVEVGDAIISPRKLQYAIVNNAGREFLIVNYHGLWVNGPKTDSSERIEQSKKIKEFVARFKLPTIVCGDFNLLPETESVRILEEGMVNLIREHKIESTRTPLYRHYTNPAEPNFADYIFVSPDIKVQRFEVLPDLASDHSPLLLDFE